jgi:hypothetical protein
MVEASATGLLRMILILIGIFVILRFIGRIFIAKQNIAQQNDMKMREKKAAFEKENAMKNFGKTKILRQKQVKVNDEPIIDIDYTDVKES